VSLLKRIVLISASAGAGAALMASLIAGGLLWYSSRPERPKPWNSKAIVATFDYPGVEGDVGKRTIVLYYTLENTTDYDYRMPKRDQLDINGRLSRENSLTAGGTISIDEDENFFPAKQRRRFAVHLGYPINVDLGPDAKTREDYRRQWQIIANFMKAELTNLNGFVIFDPSQRFQIDFPNGWDNLDLK
jgi:hypothetical protein